MVIADQAVIPAAGRGSRMQREDDSVKLNPATEAIVKRGIKALVPIHGKPFLDYSLRRLMDAGIRRVCFIVSPDSDPLREYIAGLPGRFAGLHAGWVVQPEARGTAHALRFARPATGNRDFVMINSDNLYPTDAMRELTEAPTGACYAVGFDAESLAQHSNFDESRVSQLGILAPRSDRPELLDRVVEKPEKPDEYRREGKLWVTMNLWRFTPAIYDFCDRVQESERHEFELPTAVQDLSNSGIPVRMLRCSEGVLDLTSRADIGRLESVLSP